MKTLTTLVLTTFLALTVGCSMTGPARADDGYFSQAELDSMLAPVALYPDSVLSHVLIAATYPLEVIQAARWSREHPGLRGEDAVAAADRYDWDPSVKALVAFPELLRRMDEDLDWTQDLGDAFLVQEADVIASIQYLRSEAYSQGHLRSNERVRVVREKEYIYIEPARTRVVYVPYYDPRVIYTSWRWSSHPPRYWHRPSGYSGGLSFYWGHAYHIRPSFYFSSFHWPTRKLVVVNHHHYYYNDYRFRSGREVARFKEARHWKHDPAHRRGVSYRGRVQESRFVESSRSVSATKSAGSTSSTSQRAAVRSERREWADSRRSTMNFDRRSPDHGAAVSRSERSSGTSGSSRSESAAAKRGDRGSRTTVQRSESAADSGPSNRSASGEAPQRSESAQRSSRAGGPVRSSSDRAGRLSQSLRDGSSSSSRVATTPRSREADRSSSRQGARAPKPSSSARSSRPGSGRGSSVPIPRDLTVRSSSSRERASAPSRAGGIERGSAPSRQSAPSRSPSGSRSSVPARPTPRVQSSPPSRSPKPSAPSRDSRSSTPSRGSSPSAPSRSPESSAPTRSSRGSDSRSSRSPSPSRSRNSGDSRRGGGGEERR